MYILCFAHMASINLRKGFVLQTTHRKVKSRSKIINGKARIKGRFKNKPTNQ